jgi:rhomboid protease GluP
MELKLKKTFLSGRPSPVSLMVASIGLLSLVLVFMTSRDNLSANGHLVYGKHQYWRAFTTTLLHADLNHLAHNAFFFTGLAALLHHYFGFFVFPLLSFIVGGLINLIALWSYPPEVHLVGVSGVVYFMASFWLTLYLLIERRQSIKVRILHSVAVSLIFFFPQVFRPEVSYLAHGLGFLFGFPLGILYFFINKKRIRAREEWVEIIRKPHPMDNVILLESGEFEVIEEKNE